MNASAGTNRTALFDNYWRRIQLRKEAMTIPAPCLRWQRMPGFNQVERFIWDQTHKAYRILDFGSGDQSMRNKFLAAGFQGEYATFDVSPEFPTTYRSVDDIRGTFDAVLCLEVIEHMPLREGLELRKQLLSWVAPGGTLVLSTPNPGCISSPFARDETHLHLYALHDLLTWALSAGLQPVARRVKLLPDKFGWSGRLRLLVQRVLCYAIGSDYADGLLIIARKPDEPEPTRLSD
jgi:SAM-dependent methyltransferase